MEIDGERAGARDQAGGQHLEVGDAEKVIEIDAGQRQTCGLFHRHGLDAFGIRPGGNVGVNGCHRPDGMARLQPGFSAGHQQAAIANKNGISVDHRHHLQQSSVVGAWHHASARPRGARKEMGLIGQAVSLERGPRDVPCKYTHVRALNRQRN